MRNVLLGTDLPQCFFWIKLKENEIYAGINMSILQTENLKIEVLILKLVLKVYYRLFCGTFHELTM